MSITRKRAGRAAWGTQVRFHNTVGEFFNALAEKKWIYSQDVTKAMVIERFFNGKREVITFSQAYAELSGWLDRSFANISDMGFSDMLCETFLQGATLGTAKAEYRLWRGSARIN